MKVEERYEEPVPTLRLCPHCARNAQYVNLLTTRPVKGDDGLWHLANAEDEGAAPE